MQFPRDGSHSNQIRSERWLKVLMQRALRGFHEGELTPSRARVGPPLKRAIAGACTAQVCSPRSIRPDPFGPEGASTSRYRGWDGATIEVDDIHYFNLHEITNKDAFQVTYANDKAHGKNMALESIASVSASVGPVFNVSSAVRTLAHVVVPPSRPFVRFRKTAFALEACSQQRAVGRACRLCARGRPHAAAGEWRLSSLPRFDDLAKVAGTSNACSTIASTMQNALKAVRCASSATDQSEALSRAARKMSTNSR